MDILYLVKVFFSRWYLSLPILLVGAGIAITMQLNVPPEYEATGTVLLEDPVFDPSRLTISVVELDVIAQEVGDDIDPSGEDIGIRVRDGMDVEVAAVASTPEAASALARGALSEISDRVEQIQDDAGISGPDRVELPIIADITEPQERTDGSFQVVLTSSLDDPAARAGNPYAVGSATADLVQAAVMSDAGFLEFEEQVGEGVGFFVETASRDGSILAITTVGPNASDVVGAFEVVRALLQSELAIRQDRALVPSSRQIQVEVLAAPVDVTDVSPPLSRSVAAVIGLSGLLSLAAVVVAESIVVRRRSEQVTGDPDSGPWWPLDQDDAEDEWAASDRTTGRSVTPEPTSPGERA